MRCKSPFEEVAVALDDELALLDQAVIRGIDFVVTQAKASVAKVVLFKTIDAEGFQRSTKPMYQSSAAGFCASSR